MPSAHCTRISQTPLISISPLHPGPLIPSRYYTLLILIDLPSFWYLPPSLLDIFSHLDISSGSECLIRAVDTGVFDAHKTYAVLLVCLVYIEQEAEGVSEETMALIRTSLIPECVEIMNRFTLLQWILSSPVDPTPPQYDNFGNMTISERGGSRKPRTILHQYLASRHPNLEYTGLEEMKKTVVAIINAMYPGSKLLDLPHFLLSSQYYEKLKVLP